jgi:hypothetical protein
MVLKTHKVKTFREKGSTRVDFNFLYTDKYLIVAKVCEGEISTRVYFAPDNFVPGNRKDLVDSGQVWLFKEPQGDWAYNDLEYNDVITNEFDGREVNFQKKGDSFYGTAGTQFSQVTEWYGDHVNPHLLALETGDANDGGYIEFYMGCDLAEHDYEILNQ